MSEEVKDLSKKETKEVEEENKVVDIVKSENKKILDLQKNN